MYILYKTTCLINNMIYVGVHKNITEEFDGYFGSGKRLKSSIKKYGEINFKRETLLESDDRDEIYNIEYLIVDNMFCNRIDTYNLKVGGFGGKDHNVLKEENKKSHGDNISIALRNYNKNLKDSSIPHPNSGKKRTKPNKKSKSTKLPSDKANFMRGISYENHPKGMLGKSHTMETKKILSDKNKEYIKINGSPPRTKETKDKISNSMKGRPGNGTGSKRTLEQKLKLIQEKVTCSYCNLTGGIVNMKRYHFENCKLKEFNVTS